MGNQNKMMEDLGPKYRLEDFYLLKFPEEYHIVCHDNMEEVKEHKRWGVNFTSNNRLTQPPNYVLVTRIRIRNAVSYPFL